MSILVVHGTEIHVPEELLSDYESHYGTGEASDVEDVLNELVKPNSSNIERDAVRKLEWAVRQVEGMTPSEARSHLEEMIKDGEDYGIE